MLKENDKKWVYDTVQKITRKMNVVSERSKLKIPYTSIDGVHDDYNNSSLPHRINEGINWWTNGFWGGMMWLMFHETGDSKYVDIARYSEEKLDQCFVDFFGLHHDVGMMWLPTAVAHYRLTNNQDSLRRGLHAANLLAGRFNSSGKYIRAWNEMNQEDVRGWAIIDCLLNIPLLYWATDVTNDPRYKQIAMMHADTAMEDFIRADGSSEHIVEFDPNNGVKVKTHGGQGYENGSSWTRGQAWALYGFILSYIHTKKQDYLDTTIRVADYYISNIPKNGIIPVDFKQPTEPEWEDSTAAAIAACGFIELYRCSSEVGKERYLETALFLLKTLEEKRCDWSEQHDGILLNGTEAYHAKTHHMNIVYGDYFFMEAIFKLKGDDILLW